VKRVLARNQHIHLQDFEARVLFKAPHPVLPVFTPQNKFIAARLKTGIRG
jgi:hypothetical protein